jgi:hypothetical protein
MVSRSSLFLPIPSMSRLLLWSQILLEWISAYMMVSVMYQCILSTDSRTPSLFLKFEPQGSSRGGAFPARLWKMLSSKSAPKPKRRFHQDPLGQETHQRHMLVCSKVFGFHFNCAQVP